MADHAREDCSLHPVQLREMEEKKPSEEEEPGRPVLYVERGEVFIY